jgi:hypothetical protein
MITNHIHYAPFSEDAIRERTPYVRGYEIRSEGRGRHGFGKYSCAMAEYLEMCDGEDEWTGNTEFGGFVRRFGRRLLECDDRGFVDCWRYPTEQEAIDEFNRIDAAYSAWMDDEDEEVGQ